MCYSFRTDHASARRRAAPARTGSKPTDFVGAAVTGTVGGKVGGTAGGVVSVVAGVVTVVCTVVATVVGTDVGTLVTAAVGTVVPVFALMSGFCSWSSRPAVPV